MSRKAGHGLLTTDAALRVRSWNDWLASVSGLSEADVAGRPLLDLVPPGSRAHYQEICAEVLEQGAARVLSPALHPAFLALSAPLPAEPTASMEQLVTIAPLRDGDVVAGLIVTIEDLAVRREDGRVRNTVVQTAASSREAVEAVGADWRSRAPVVRTLTQYADDEQIAELLRSLERQHMDLNVLSGALQVLVGSRRSSHGPLVRLLGDADANMRMHAAQALGLLHQREAVAPLVAALHDTDTNVRFHAMEALGRLRAPEAIEPLLRIVRSNDFFLAFPAIDALALIDDPAVSHELIPLLRHETLGAAVVEALRVVGDEECVAPLMHCLEEGRLDPSAVAATILAIHDRYDEQDKAGPHIRDRVRVGLTATAVRRLAAAVEVRAEPLEPTVRMLGWAATGGADVLAGLLGESDVTAAAADALHGRGSAAVDAVIARLRDGGRDSRLAAAELLGRLADRRATTELMDAMDQGDSELTAVAARSLAAIADDRALPALSGLFHDVDARVRRAASAAVNAIGGREAERLAVTSAIDPNPHVRECAVRTAGYLGFDPSGRIIRDGLADVAEVVRRAAIEHVPFLEGDDPGALLIGCLRAETPSNRAAAAHALRHIVTRETSRALVESLSEPDSWVRYFAADSLRVHAWGDAADALVRVVEQDDAPQARIAALRALSASAPARASKLAATLIGAPDDDLAVAAIQALDEDPDSVEQLTQATFSSRPMVRLAAVDALGDHVAERSVSALREAARQPVDPPLAVPAIVALGRIAATGGSSVAAQAVSTLLDLATHGDWRDPVLRTASAWSPELLNWITGWLQHQPVPIRRVAVDALSRMQHPGASDVIAGRLHDEDATVRTAAISAVGRLGSLGAAASAIALATADPDPGVRRRAASACRRHGWPTDASIA